MKEKSKGFITEFKQFIMRGNVLDMAIGVVIATAFGKITTSLVNDIIMPFIGWLIGGIDLSTLNITLKPELTNEVGEILEEAVVIGIGTFLVTIIDFLIIAFVVFIVVKLMNKAMDITKGKKKKEEEKPEEPVPPTTEELLAQILDELKNKK